jgi:hypothetical protein
MEDGSFGSAQIAFGKTKAVDAKSLVTIIEHEEGPNTAAILLPSDKKDSINNENRQIARQAPCQKLYETCSEYAIIPSLEA